MRTHHALAAIASVVAALSAHAWTFASPQTSFTTGGRTIYIDSNEGIGCRDCEPPQVFFGGVESPHVRVVDRGKIAAVTPPYPAEEIVDVKVVTPGKVLTIENAFAYEFDRVRVLVPVSLAGLEGNSGTSWSSDLWVYNDNEHAVSLQPAICSGLGGVFYCGRDPLVVEAKTARRIPPLPISRLSVGEYLYVPRQDAPGVSFQLRVGSSVPGDDGTAVPVIRDPQAQSKLVILGIPGGDASRKLLRVYVAGSASIRVDVYDMESGALLGSERLELSLPTDGSGPAQGALTLSTSAVFEAAGARDSRRLRVEIVNEYPATLLWAMVSVTNNATQRVLVLTPQ